MTTNDVRGVVIGTGTVRVGTELRWKSFTRVTFIYRYGEFRVDEGD